MKTKTKNITDVSTVEYLLHIDANLIVLAANKDKEFPYSTIKKFLNNIVNFEYSDELMISKPEIIIATNSNILSKIKKKNSKISTNEYFAQISIKLAESVIRDDMNRAKYSIYADARNTPSFYYVPEINRSFDSIVDVFVYLDMLEKFVSEIDPVMIETINDISL